MKSLCVKGLSNSLRKIIRQKCVRVYKLTSRITKSSPRFAMVFGSGHIHKASIHVYVLYVDKRVWVYI